MDLRQTVASPALHAELRHSWIDGGPRASSGAPIFLIEPGTSEPTGEVNTAGPDIVDAAVSSARRAFAQWGRSSPAERQRLLNKFADKIEAETQILAALEALEVGRPVGDAAAVIHEGAAFLRQTASLIDHIGGDVVSAGEQRTSLVWRRPRGVVAAITPWNVPSMNVLARVAPALAAGNAVVVKPSENSPRSAVFLARLASQAGLPDGVFNVVLGDGPTTGRRLAAHDGVNMVAFTGSTATGLEITRLSATNSLKPVLLECGGKSPLILMDDVPATDSLWQSVFFSAFWNSGQWCIAKTRIILPRARLEEAVDGLDRAAGEWPCGDPFHSQTRLGPLANKRQFDNVRRYLDQARNGAGVTELRVPNSGRDPRGYYVQPSIVTDVPRSSAVWQEEIFGPLAVLQPFDTAEQAIELANDTRYGLAATLVTNRTELAFKIARSVEAGIVDICTTPASTSGWSPLQYFEPVKQSGLGIDSGLHGLRAYTSAQTVSFSY